MCGREGITVDAGLDRQPLGLCQQVLPFGVWQAAAIPVRACVFPSVVEEALIVVTLFQRGDLLFDELVDFGEEVGDIDRYFKIHVVALCASWAALPAGAGIVTRVRPGYPKAALAMALSRVRGGRSGLA